MLDGDGDIKYISIVGHIFYCSGFSREIIYIIYMYLIYVRCGSRGREVPWPAICKLRTRKAGGLVQSESRGLIIGWGFRADGVSSDLTLKANEPEVLMSKPEDRCLSSIASERERESNFTFPPPFCFIQLFNRLDDVHLHW